MYLPPQNYLAMMRTRSILIWHSLLWDNLLLEVQDIRLTKLGRIMMDEEIPWDHRSPEDLKAQDSQQDWTEVVHKSRSNASTNTSSTSSSHSGKIVNWYGKPVGVNKDGTSYSKKPYGWIETENAIGGSNRFIFFAMPPGAKYGRQHGTTVQFDVEYNNTPIGRCANISHVVCF
jgi:hypothetical protein